jgi:uncharacterized delta-60 repeat protein
MRLFKAIGKVKRRLAPAALWLVLSFVPLDTQGGVIEAWVQRYDSGAKSNDMAAAVAIDLLGNVVVTGGSHNGTNTDFYTAKYAATNSALLWEHRYNGPFNGLDHADALALDAPGNVFVTGVSDGGIYQHFYTAKYAAADGALLWERRITNGFGRGRAIAIDSNGNVAVTGFFADVGHVDYYTARYAGANGALLWEKRYNGPANQADEVRAIAIDGAGNVVVTGTSFNSFSNTVFYTAKYAVANGALLWEQRYQGSTENYGQAVAIDSSGNVLVTGISAGGGNPDFYTAKYAAANGALLWERRYNGPGNGDDDARDIAVDLAGDVVVTGYSYNTNGNSDCYTVKYSGTNGAVLWERRYNSPQNASDLANAVALDSSGNPVIAGISSDDSRNHDYYTAKYAAADGILLWEKRYNGPANGADLVVSPHCLALGPDGFIAVAGYSDGNFGPDTTYDYATILYREPLPPVSMAIDSNAIHLRFRGIPERAYHVQRAHLITGPWDTIGTSTAPGDGMIEYTDTMPLPGMAFYRTTDGP